MNSQVVPQCVICYENLSNHAVGPSRLQRYFQTKHPDHKDKLLALFQCKKNCLKKLKIASKSFQQFLSAETADVLFEIAHMIAKKKKSYNVHKTLIKLCMSKTAGPLLGKTYSKMAKVSLSVL